MDTVYIILCAGNYYGAYKEYPTQMQMRQVTGSIVTTQDYAELKRTEILKRMGYVWCVKKETLK